MQNQQKTIKIRQQSMIMLLIMLLSACTDPRYLLVIDNQSESSMRQVKVSFSGFSITTHDLQPGQHETAIFEQPRLGEQLNIEWQSLHSQHQVSFNTYDHIPNSHHQGKVVIRINPDQTAQLYYQPAVK